MALVYFVDNDLDPVEDADAFGTVEAVDLHLSYHPRWMYLEDEEKEALIIAATAQLNALDFKGQLVEDTQALQFPRAMSTETSGLFTRKEQVRRLFRSLVQQIEYNLNRAGMGMVTYSHGNESFTPRQDTIAREALQTLLPYVRQW